MNHKSTKPGHYGHLTHEPNYISLTAVQCYGTVQKLAPVTVATAQDLPHFRERHLLSGRPHGKGDLDIVPFEKSKKNALTDYYRHHHNSCSHSLHYDLDVKPLGQPWPITRVHLASLT